MTIGLAARPGRTLAVAALAIFTLTPPAAPRSPAGIFHHARISVQRGPTGSAGGAGWASSNWSGYAVTGGTYTSVAGSWTVPAVSRTKKATYSASWVGIDGFKDSSLIQAGTEQDFYGGAAHYYAWWEILPAAEQQIGSLDVRPGDRMRASISDDGGAMWTITISDASRGQSYSTRRSYSGPLSSAEWIEEAPTVGGRTATLAHYGSSIFDPGTANGRSPGLVSSDAGVMVQGGSQVSTPSRPDSDADGFDCAYGSARPSPPST